MGMYRAIRDADPFKTFISIVVSIVFVLSMGLAIQIQVRNAKLTNFQRDVRENKTAVVQLNSTVHTLQDTIERITDPKNPSNVQTQKQVEQAVDAINRIESKLCGGVPCPPPVAK